MLTLRVILEEHLGASLLCESLLVIVIERKRHEFVNYTFSGNKEQLSRIAIEL